MCAQEFGQNELASDLRQGEPQEEPENADYPKDPRFKQRFGPRGVLHSWATGTDDSTVDPQFGKVGKQRIQNAGPLDTKRMETVDEEFLDGASTSAATPSKRPSANPLTTSTGSLAGSSCLCRPSSSSGSGSRASRSFRHGRDQPASASTK